MGGVDEQTCMEIPTNLYIVYIHIMPTKKPFDFTDTTSWKIKSMLQLMDFLDL